MKRLYGSNMGLGMVLAIAGSSGVAFSVERAEWNSFSNDAGVEYVLECCDILKATMEAPIGESDIALMAFLEPEDFYGP
ncbi:MAG: hypothetical protein GTO40_28740 [Deltaproteobacteria bacterium]|nr:hypothetical protein [Deltaproteobacteria bacterium]NIO16679.1 hypothetical protein [Deltaproteobacteria bacterium]NIS77390.1 hypothetical protein [Deltaproteobacteria bacterium]